MSFLQTELFTSWTEKHRTKLFSIVLQSVVETGSVALGDFVGLWEGQADVSVSCH